MSKNESAILTFERWWQEWGDHSRGLGIDEAKQAVEELQRIVDQYFSK